MRGSTAAGRIVVGARCLQRLQWDAALCRRHVGSVRMLAHDLDVDDCPDFLSPPQRMSVMERARQVQGLAGRRVRRARPSESRAGTVAPLSVRTLTGGDVGIGRDVRPSYVQVGAGARMYGFTPRGGRALPSIRALDNMDTPLSRRTVGNGPGPGGRGFERRRRLQTHGASCSHWGLESRPTRRRDPMRLTTVLLGVTRALAAVKARCSAPPPLRGADGLDAGSAHARPGSCLTMTHSPTPESEATSRPEITVRSLDIGNASRSGIHDNGCCTTSKRRGRGTECNSRVS